MQLPHFRTTTRVSIAVILATAAALFGRTGALPTAAANTPPAVATEAATAQSDKKSRVQHFARVKSDGTLVNGTAISAERFGEGFYFVRFADRIGECGAAANSASFPGFDLSVFRIMAQLSIGVGPGGAPDDFSVGVSLFASDGTNRDSAFSLLLSCP
jgi:hypothetical protein